MTPTPVSCPVPRETSAPRLPANHLPSKLVNHPRPNKLPSGTFLCILLGKTWVVTKHRPTTISLAWNLLEPQLWRNPMLFSTAPSTLGAHSDTTTPSFLPIVTNSRMGWPGPLHMSFCMALRPLVERASARSTTNRAPHRQN
jgi:hypothetical protein